VPFSAVERADVINYVRVEDEEVTGVVREERDGEQCNVINRFRFGKWVAFFFFVWKSGLTHFASKTQTAGAVASLDLLLASSRQQ
jgi:hypothetical protein